MKIEIKLATAQGKQQFRGEDLTNEHADKLIELAKLAIEQTAATAISSGPYLAEAVSFVGPFPVADDAVVNEATLPSAEAPAESPVSYGTPFVSKPFEKLSALVPTSNSNDTHKEDPFAKENENYFETGIKYKDIRGEKRETYRTRCECPRCETKGNRYLTEGTKRTFCHSCNTPLLVETPEGKKFPNRDEFGNFYVANRVDPKFVRA